MSVLLKKSSQRHFLAAIKKNWFEGPITRIKSILFSTKLFKVWSTAPKCKQYSLEAKKIMLICLSFSEIWKNGVTLETASSHQRSLQQKGWHRQAYSLSVFCQPRKRFAHPQIWRQLCFANFSLKMDCHTFLRVVYEILKRVKESDSTWTVKPDFSHLFTFLFTFSALPDSRAVVFNSSKKINQLV